MNQIIKINGFEYEVLDSYEDYRMEDSFCYKNKLKEFRGHGEAKKHVGSYSGNTGKKLNDFYDYSSWGKPHADPNKSNRKTLESAIKEGAIISDQCFFTKSNLLKYLETAKVEYQLQEQVYHNNIIESYNERIQKIKRLNNEALFFTIYDASDNISQNQNRGYIRSDDSIWSIWREIILPKISYLSINKLRKIGTKNCKPFFYFKIFLDYNFREFKHPKLVFPLMQKTGSTKRTSSGRPYSQEKFKIEVHDYMAKCPFTKISDERLLTASHIKPSIVCLNENKVDQAKDYHNGLTLSPTFDRLFDKGYMTFSDDGKLICGTEISMYNWGKLSINPTQFKTYDILPNGREKYLKFHRENVFLGNADELFF